MPTLDTARISTDGTGTISFQADDVPSAPLLTTASGNLALTGITVSGENIGPGFGLFAGLDSSPPAITLLKFKSLLSGRGIILNDLGDSVMIATEGATFFTGLADGPAHIIGNAVLLGNAVSGKLEWSATPHTANSVLTWTGNTIGWLPVIASVPLLGNGDEAIAVTITPGANTQTINVSLRDTMVVAGAYTSPSFTVDSQGRIVSITNGTQAPLTGFRILSDGTIQVSGSPVSASSNTVTLSLADISPSVAGSYAFASLIVDSKGRVTGITGHQAPLTQITGDTAIGANTSTANGAVSLSLLPSGVSAGQYSYATVTIDQTGRITNAVAGQAVSRIDVTTDANLTVTGAPIVSNGTLSFALANTAVTAGLYSFASLTIDAQGRVQNAVSGVLTPGLALAGLQANAANVVSLYAGTANAIGYFSSLRASANVTVSLSNTAVIAGQIANSGVISIDLGDTGVSAGTYSTVTIDRKGRVTAGAQIQIAGGNLTGDVLGNATGQASFANGVYTFANITTTLASIFGGSATFTQVVVNSKGLVTAGSFTNAVAGLSLTLAGDATGSGLLSNTINLTLKSVMTPGTYSQVTVDAAGRVVNGVVATNQTVGFINLSGDITALGNSTAVSPVVTTLAASGVTAGTYTQIVVNSKGLITQGLRNVSTVSLTGDISGSENANGIVSATLAATGVVAGTYGAATVVPTITIDAKGRITNVSTSPVGGITPSTTLTGDVTGTGTGTVATTLAASGATPGTYGAGSLIPVLAVDGKGRITSVSTIAVAPATPSNAQVISALGYTPVNKAGDTMTGSLTAPSLHVTGGIYEQYQALSASNIDLSVATYFSKTISGTTTLTLTNVIAGVVNSFMLELTNGGSATINYWSNVTWAGGIKPTLTTSGVDLLAFVSYNGVTWRGLVLAKAMA